MLTRIVVLEADYSSALTMLLRYPVPAAPHGPITFVEDALYLRKNLNTAGGAHLIAMYTGRSPNSEGMSHNAGGHRRPLHTPQSSVDLSRARSPLRSPSIFLSEAGGLENILQEAAKGVYKRSEKWGSSLRGAVQGLQQGSQSPRGAFTGIRWSLDDGKDVASTETELNSRILALEERNKALAKMLQDAMDDLSQQAQNLEANKSETEANALTLTIAKLQFVHVYLENSTMPLASEFNVERSNLHETAPVDANSGSGESEKSLSHSGPANNDLAPPVPPKNDPPNLSDASDASVSPTRSKPVRRRPPTNLTETKSSDHPEPSLLSPFQHPRPTLTQSSFSWMLGEDKTKDDFVSASPFSPEQTRTPERSQAKIAARGRAGFLFGEEKVDVVKSKISDEEDEDGFTMGTLQGVSKI